MRTRLLAAALCGAIAPTVATVSTPAQAAATPWISCSFSGVAHMTTPMTLTQRRIRFTSVVRFDQCSSSDHSIVSGVAHTTGALDGSCATAAGTAVQRIRWSNHRSSLIRGAFWNVGPELARERVDRGEFRGASGGNVNVEFGSPSDLSGCMGAGITSARFVGRIVLSG